jgi:NhaA family Na+:H+ antiporter
VPTRRFAELTSVTMLAALVGDLLLLPACLLAMIIPVKATIDPKQFFSIPKQHKTWLKGSKVTRRSMVADKQQLRAIGRIYLAAEQMIPAGIRLEEHLHPIQAFLILPLFALFAAGVTVNADTLATFPDSISLGILNTHS